MTSLKDRLSQQAQEAGEFPDYPVITWEPGTVVAGIVKRISRRNLREDAEGVLTTILTVDDEVRGEPVTVFLGAARLRTWIEEDVPGLEEGWGVYIECYDVDPQQRDMKLFRAAVDKDPEAPSEPEPEPTQESMDDVPF